ncbi:unnamed protein product [Adineta steineri]|uniref:Uncharacterized protein n=1 Tax=Adineta steineri TaxID=433720 RepID=A0A814VJK9_9BILA|nr:unnamed protein product [Adineta steineri]
MQVIISYQIFFFLFYLLHISLSIKLYAPSKTSLRKSLIQRRQLLDGTAKSDGVAPKPPGSDNFFNNNIITSLTQQTTIHYTYSTTSKLIKDELANDRSIKDQTSSQSSSKAGLIASIVAPTGILGVIGAAVGAYFFKKNQTNSSTNENGGFFSNLFSSNFNASKENKSEEKYLLVGNIS